MDKSMIATWLGRSLTPSEDTNFDSYLKNAFEKVEELLCFSLSCKGYTKKFNGRDGMSTVFTGVFTTLYEVRRNGTVVTDYEEMFFDNPNGKFFNSLVFNCKLNDGDRIEVDAKWGFKPLPSDLQQLIAKYFALSSGGVANNSGVKSKRVEDFDITFDDKTAEERLIADNQSVINKYSLCNTTNIRSGKVCRVWI